jgi:hypothetical protein
VLDLERVRQPVRPVVDDQPFLDILAADLVVDLRRRRDRPRRRSTRSVSGFGSYRTGSPFMA